MLKQRHVWADAVRGLCIIAVVIYHICAWHYLSLEIPKTYVHSAWDALNRLFGSVRMPVLLGISGVLVARRIRLGWKDDAFLIRAGNSYYIFAIWTILLAAVYSLTSRAQLPHAFEGFQDTLKQFVAPSTPLWFIFALAVYVIILTVLNNVSSIIIIAALSSISVLISVTGDLGLGLAAKVPQYFVFFAVGVYFSDWLRDRPETISGTRLTFLAMFMASLFFLSVLPLPPVIDGILLVTRGVGSTVLAFVVIQKISAQLPGIVGIAAYCGKRALPIYVLHIPIVFGIIVLSTCFGIIYTKEGIIVQLILAIYPLFATAVVVILCLLIHQVFIRVGLRALFEPPRWFQGALGAAHRILVSGSRIRR